MNSETVMLNVFWGFTDSLSRVSFYPMSNAMETTVKLTNLELAILNAIASSEYGDELNSAIWTFSVWDNIDRSACKSRQSLSGGMASLTKKGLVVSSDVGTEEACVTMTHDGVKALVERHSLDMTSITKSLNEQSAREIWGDELVNNCVWVKGDDRNTGGIHHEATLLGVVTLIRWN